MSTYDIFLPKITITNLDTTETMKQKIVGTIQNMNIGKITLFDLFFSKKHNNHYAFISLELYVNYAAVQFVRSINDRGFAKLLDKDYYWKVVKYIDPDYRRPSVVLNNAFIQEEDEIVSVEDVSVEDVSVEDVSVEDVSVEDVSVEDVLVDDVLVEDVSVDDVLVDDVLVDDVLVDDVLVDDVLEERLFAEEYAAVLESDIDMDVLVIKKDNWEDPHEDKQFVFSDLENHLFQMPDYIDINDIWANELTPLFPEWSNTSFPIPNCLILKQDTNTCLASETDFDMFARRVLGRSLFDELCSV